MISQVMEIQQPYRAFQRKRKRKFCLEALKEGWGGEEMPTSSNYFVILVDLHYILTPLHKIDNLKVALNL